MPQPSQIHEPGLAPSTFKHYCKPKRILIQISFVDFSPISVKFYSQNSWNPPPDLHCRALHITDTPRKKFDLHLGSDLDLSQCVQEQYRYPARQAVNFRDSSKTENLEVFLKYLSKIKGGGKSPVRADLHEIIWSWVGAFAGIALVGYLHVALVGGSTMIMLIGSFGASAVLIYGAPKSPLAQPRNLLGGHFLSALVGVACIQIFNPAIWLAAAVAVATAIALMHLTRTLHPPGGATALIAVIDTDAGSTAGFCFALAPVLTGALIMLAVALIVNNIPASRRYPEFWW